MSEIFLRKYGTATTIDFALYGTDGVDLKTDASFDAGDLKIMKDEGDEGNTANLPTDEGQGYSLVLSETEEQAARIKIYIVDQTSPKTWLDRTITIETYGHASAQHAFDLNSTFASMLLTSTGLTTGGTWTLAKLMKVQAAFFTGQKQLKSGQTNVYQFLDPDDGSTVVLEMTVSSSTPYFTFSVQI